MARRLLVRQRGLLRRSPAFRLLFLSTVGSGLGTLLATVALTVDVYDRTHSGSWVSALLVADFLPAVAIGIALGPLVDRLSRRRLMIASDVIRAGAFSVLPFVGTAGAIVAVAAVVGFATGFFRPAVYAGLPNLVDESDLPHANALLRLGEWVTWAAGPILGGILVAASGPHLCYWLNAVTFLVSALLITRIGALALQAKAAESRGHWHDVAEGFGLFRRSPALMTVLVAWTIAMLGNAAFNVAEVVLAKVSFDAGNFGYGFLYASAGLGLALGSFAAGGAIDRFRMAWLYGGAFAVMAVGTGAAAVSPNVWVGAAFVLLFGIGNGVAGICNSVLVQRGAPDELRGRAFTVVMSVNYAMLGLGMGLAGLLTDAVGARWTWGAAAASYAVAAVAGTVLARGVSGDVGTDAVEPTPALVAEGLTPAD